jgi:hypothetical protein
VLTFVTLNTFSFEVILLRERASQNCALKSVSSISISISIQSPVDNKFTPNSTSSTPGKPKAAISSSLSSKKKGPVVLGFSWDACSRKVCLDLLITLLHSSVPRHPALIEEMVQTSTIVAATVGTVTTSLIGMS